MSSELVEPTIDLTALRAARKGPFRPYLEVRFKPLDVTVDINELIEAVEKLAEATVELKFALAGCDAFDEHDHYIPVQKATLALRRLGYGPAGTTAPPLEATA